MKKCVKCGYQLEVDALFCAGCGTKQPVAGAGNDSSVPTEDIRDPGNMAVGHDPHRNTYVANGHGPDRELHKPPKQDAHRNAGPAEGQVQDPSARTAAKKERHDPSGKAKQRSGKKRHPVLSVFLLILFFLCFNVGLISLYIHHTFSTEHLEEVILETDISEIEIGAFARSVLVSFEDQLDDSEYNDLVDMMDELFDMLEEDTTFGELVKKGMIDDPLTMAWDSKSRPKALNSLAFKKEMANIITKYTSDIFFDSGKGKIDTDDVTDLEYAYYSAFFKEELRKSRDDGAITEQDYKYLIDIYTGEELRRTIKTQLESYPGFDDDSLKELSVKKMFKDQPLWIVRVLASTVFGLGMIVLGSVLLVLSYLINRNGIKKALIRTGIVLAVEMILIGLFLIGVKITESVLTSGTAKAIGGLMIDLMRE